VLFWVACGVSNDTWAMAGAERAKSPVATSAPVANEIFMMGKSGFVD
jgi:hypothetical protein